MARGVPFRPRIAARGMVTAADQLAASAGVAMLDHGGSAADAIVAAAAVMAVVGPHLCGLGGDALAMLKAPDEAPLGLLSIGRAGSGADPERLRADGHSDMPQRGDVRSVPVPGAVDGWLALHTRFGRLRWDAVLEPAIGLAEEGFAASLLLALASHLVAAIPGASELCPNGPLEPGQVVRLPGVARTLRELATGGREAFYGGTFGRALLDLGDGEYTRDDLTRSLAEWVEPLRLRAFGHDLWTVPPPSQGYLTLASTWIADRVGLPTDTTDPLWPHIVAEASRAAGSDRPQVLYDGADGEALLAIERLERQASALDGERTGLSRPGTASRSVGGSPLGAASPPSGASPPSASRQRDGDTTHLCAVDADGMGISLTQSNALDFGAHLVAGATGIFLHNRGVGFSLEPGHPGRYHPGRRPSHTLSPALVTHLDGALSQVVGTMGGDAQPQIILQLLTRTLHSGEDPATAIAAPRVVHEAKGAAPFRLWHATPRSLVIESHAPARWREGLESRGHEVRVVGAFNPVDVGCSQIISVRPGDGWILAGAADPRSPDGDAVGR